MTFSILGYSERDSSIGVAVQSKFPGVASICIHGRADVGVIATQAFSNPEHGSKGLALLELGVPADLAVQALIGADDSAVQRQLGIMTARGDVAYYLGSQIKEWKGHSGVEKGKCCMALGNNLTTDFVLKAMVDRFQQVDDALAVKLIAALRAGQDAGGERRGVQAAGVLVFKNGGGFQGNSGKQVDISIYDHPDPIGELARCYELHKLSHLPSEDKNLRKIDSVLARELTDLLVREGYLEGAPRSEWRSEEIAAMAMFMGVENYDNRIRSDDLIDMEVLADIRKKHAQKAS